MWQDCRLELFHKFLFKETKEDIELSGHTEETHFHQEDKFKHLRFGKSSQDN
ncbi:MAG: hypothetical protein RI947_226 [Candidatus Parcubacteria bacterium]